MEKKLFLLDAYALIYRSYYAFIRNPRFNSKGLNTSAIFGFVNTLEDILKTQSPTHIAVAFDLSAPTFRHEFYPAYKANREETPEDIRKSVPIIKEILKAYNIALLEAPGYEADDVIGTLAKKAEKNGFITYMMTPDKDYGQLVSDTIFMYKPRRGEGDVEILGKNEICKNFSLIDPMQFIDILALWGDVSDNVPGAPGIGEKTAIKLISEFGNIDNIYANIDKLKGKQRESLEQNKEQVYRAKKLVTIAIDAPVELDEQILMLHKPDNQKLKTIFEELEFRTMAQRLIVQPADPALAMAEETPVQPEQKQQYSIPQQGMLNLFGDEQLPTVTTAQKSFKTIQDVEHNYHLITDKEKRSELISKLSSLNEFCFDTETTGLEAIDTEIVGLSFSYKTGEAFYVPIPINREEAQSLINEFKLVFENTEIKKIGQNIKYDMLMLKAYDIDVKGEIFDTMLAHYLLQPELRHNMNFLAESYLNYSPVPIENLIGKKGKNQMSMRSVALEQISEYAGEDADITWQLKEIFEKELEKNNLSALAQKVEMPLARVLADMEFTGVSLNTKALNIFAQQLVEEIMQIEKEIYTLSGMEFNISSPQQLGKVLFDHLKISSDAKKTKTDQYSTGEEVLEKIVDAHPVIPKILEFRSLKKLHSTYVEALPKLIHKKTGKIHTSYNQALVSTGRLSSNNPNLQNIPIREERGREIRKAFIPSTAEHVFLSADYSQVELRIMAHLSQDTAMIDAFIHDEDIHAATAAKIFNIPLTEVTSDMRRKAKTANFGIIYGISSFGLAQRLSISRSEAKQLIDGYFLTYPKVKKYMDQSIFIAREKGYVETILGRRRFLPDINSKNAIVRGVAERNAINAPIQGSAADIIKIAMINIFSQFEKENLKSKMIMQVHDELNFDVLKSELDVVKNIVRNEMQQAIQLSVPLTVDIGVGENWLEAH